MKHGANKVFLRSGGLKAWSAKLRTVAPRGSQRRTERQLQGAGEWAVPASHPSRHVLQGVASKSGMITIVQHNDLVTLAGKVGVWKDA